MFRRIAILGFALFGTFPGLGIAQGEDAVLSAFEADCSELEKTSPSENLPVGLDMAGTCLLEWKHYQDFSDLTDSLRRSYSGIPPEKAAEILAFRRDYVSANPSGLGWVDVGILAQSQEKFSEAEAAFEEALKDSECCRIPNTYCLLGRAKLDIGDVSGAIQAYDQAIVAASNDAALLFRTRNMKADDLYMTRHLDEALQAMRACHESSSPLERSWGAAMELVYAWYTGDVEAARSYSGQLSNLLKDATPSASLGWQSIMRDYIGLVGGFAERALAGDPEGILAMDNVAADVCNAMFDMEGIRVRLAKYAEQYTLDEIAAITDPGIQQAALDALMSYYLAIRTPENSESSIAFFQSLLDHPYFGTQPLHRINAYCWLGYIYSNMNQLEQAAVYYEQGLSLDDENAVRPAPIGEIHPAYVLNGIINPNDRAGFVANYRNVLNRLDALQGVQR